MEEIKVHDKVFVPYMKEDDIQAIVKDMAAKIYEDYKDEVPVFVGVLNGVIMFMADLLRHYPGDCELAFLQVSSYVGTKSTGIVYKKMDLTKDVKNRHIILLEDIVDTGNTIAAIIDYFKNTQRPKSVKVASFLLKPEIYSKEFKIDYIGKAIPDRFVLGYGMDYDELGRNLKSLYQLKTGKIND